MTNQIKNYGLGRIVIPDYRDARYPMSATVDEADLKSLPDEKEWKLGPILDQGQRPMCVAYACEQFLHSEPSFETGPPTIDDIYNRAQTMDGIPGKHDGTTVRAGLAVLAAMGNIDAGYVWAYDVTTVKKFILTRGPVVFGVTWYEGMFRPNGDGLVQINGNRVGGHSFLCSGYSQSTNRFHFCNSWGENWGIGGTFYMTSDDVSSLIKDYGEAGSAIDIIPKAKGN